MNLAIILQRAKQSAPQLAKAAEEGQELLQELTQEIRTTSYLLHPPLLDESGLAEALRWYIKGLQERSGLNVALSVPEGFGRLPDETELVIFRIVQECLTNVHRHSESKSAAIRIIRDNHSVSVQVQDQGKGIPPAKLIQLQTQAAGVGIRGMRERVLQLGGAMSIRSDGGTTISITLPVPAETDKKIEGPRDDSAAVNRAFSA
jgi:signal transduction histidine kinase